jgi:hypothetical protein
MVGTTPFALFLFDCLNEEFPGGPPSPPGFGPLAWSGVLGPRRRFTFAELCTVCRAGNFSALSSGHFHLLPHHSSHTLLRQLTEALQDLGRRLHGAVTLRPRIEAHWAPAAVVDLDVSGPPLLERSPPHRGEPAVVPPARPSDHTHSFTPDALPSSKRHRSSPTGHTGGSEISASFATRRARSPLTPLEAVTSDSVTSPTTACPPALPLASSPYHKRPHPSTTTEDPRTSSLSTPDRRTRLRLATFDLVRLPVPDISLAVPPTPSPYPERPRSSSLTEDLATTLSSSSARRTRVRPASPDRVIPSVPDCHIVVSPPHCPANGHKRQRQPTLLQHWRRQAPHEVGIPSMILHSLPDDEERDSTPPPKRGRAGADDEVRLGIG